MSAEMRPSTRTVPLVGLVMPATSLSAVLLPEPFLPMTPYVEQRALERRKLPAAVAAVDLRDVRQLDRGHAASNHENTVTVSDNGTRTRRRSATESPSHGAAAPASLRDARRTMTAVPSVREICARESRCLGDSVANSLRDLRVRWGLITPPPRTNRAADRRTSTPRETAPPTRRRARRAISRARQVRERRGSPGTRPRCA